LILGTYPIFEPWHYQEATIFLSHISTQMQKKKLVEKEYFITYSLNFWGKKSVKILWKKI
jgi:hypothetical protein